MSSENQQEKPKRKTHTSSQVKARYNKKAYKQFNANVKPELYERLEAYREAHGLSRPELLQKAIDTLDK